MVNSGGECNPEDNSPQANKGGAVSENERLGIAYIPAANVVVQVWKGANEPGGKACLNKQPELD
jgi:hypothetical protein